jgi:hypothetical protein
MTSRASKHNWPNLRTAWSKRHHSEINEPGPEAAAVTIDASTESADSAIPEQRPGGVRRLEGLSAMKRGGVLVER